MSLKAKIGSRITAARKELGITIKELATRTKILTAARISNWEHGSRSPGPNEAKILADQLNVSASYLLCLTDNAQGEIFQDSENKLHLVPIFNLKNISSITDFNTENRSNIEHKTIILDEFNKSINNKQLFAVQIEDTSQEPILIPGDLVIIDPSISPKPGDYVLAYLSSKKQAVIRKYGEADDYLFQLLAPNSLWATISVQTDSQDVDIIGVVAEARKYR